MELHSNKLIEKCLPSAMSVLFRIPIKETEHFLDMDFENTHAANYHLEVITNFAQKHGYYFCGVHLTRSLGSAVKDALTSGFRVAGKICAVIHRPGAVEYHACILNWKGEVVNPLSSGLAVGDCPHDLGMLYGWYIFRKQK